eukprot:sb/3468394/
MIILSGSCLFANVTTVKVDKEDVLYRWSVSETNDGDFVEVSSLPYLYLSTELEGKYVRLSCHSQGVDVLQSKPIGPVESNPSFARLISRARPRPSPATTRVISYNILADSFMETRTKPVVNHFPWCPKKFQARAYREPRIAGEIRAHDPDIVCMQEVEGHAFDQTLQQMLPDYCGNLRTVMKGRNKVGCCIFYRRTQYQELHYETVELPQEYSSEGSLTELVAVTPSSDLTDLERSEGCPNTGTDTSKQPIRTRYLGHVTGY